MRELLTICRRAVLAVTPQVVRRGRRARRARRKGTGDFVTEVDLRVEGRLRAMLGRALPEAGFLGEETRPLGLERDFVWVVDPIDGTSNYARGLPVYAVAVACLHGRSPVAAAFWCEPEGRLYSAGRGLGAFRGRTRLRTGPAHRADAAVIGCQWHRGQPRMGFLSRLQGDGGRIRTLGSTVVQIAEVVMGRLDGNVQQQGRTWDLAAPGLLAVEAGCLVTDWRGREVFPFPSLAVEHTPTVVAPPAMHRRLLALLAGRTDPPPRGRPRD